MAKAFSTGTISQPDAGSVGLTTVETIRDALIAHAAWDLVEEFTPGGGAVRWYVFKCLAASSGLDADYFVVVGRTLATGELRFALCEGYNAAGHTMSGMAPMNSGSAITYDADGANPNTYVLGTAAFPSNSNTPHYNRWLPNSTSTKYWLIIDDDGFTVAFNGAQNDWVHIGAYESLSDLANDMPIQIMGSNGSQGYGAITRNPAVAGFTSPYGMALIVEGGNGGVGQYSGKLLGFNSDLRYNDKLQTNQRPVAEQGINVYNYNGDSPQVHGWAIGKQKRMRIGGGQIPAGFAFGDAFALGGTLWVPFHPTDLRIWDTGVASS